MRFAYRRMAKLRVAGGFVRLPRHKRQLDLTFPVGYITGPSPKFPMS
jgi:hypothetical protein